MSSDIRQLKGTAILFGARIVAVADSFDAMTSDRPYRTGMSGEVAMGILRAGRYPVGSDRRRGIRVGA